MAPIPNAAASAAYPLMAPSAAKPDHASKGTTSGAIKGTQQLAQPTTAKATIPLRPHHALLFLKISMSSVPLSFGKIARYKLK
jgi:hypothetical protein